MTLLYITLWLGISFLNWGLTLGDFTRQFPYMKNTGPAVFTAVFGPLALPVVLIKARPYTWRLHPFTDDQRWEIFQKQCPTLAADYGRSAMDGY